MDSKHKKSKEDLDAVMELAISNNTHFSLLQRTWIGLAGAAIEALIDIAENTQSTR